MTLMIQHRSMTSFPRHMAACGWLLLMAGLQLPGEVRAQSADQLLKQCIQHYAMADFPTSLAACWRAAGRTKDSKKLAKIHLYIGLNQMGLGKNGQARKAFAGALTHDPGLTMDPRQHKKAVVALFAEVQKSNMGLLSVKADRAGALVFVNGKKVGTVPFEGRFPVGKHWLIVRSPDNRYMQEMSVTMARGRNQLVLSLKAVHGYLNVRSEPPGADVLVNNQPIGKTPVKEHHLKPGLYRVTLRMEGRPTIHRSVNIQLDRESTLSLALSAGGSEPAPPGPSSDRVKDDTPEPAVSFWKRKRIWTWVASGTAVVAAGVGLGLGLSALSDHDEYMETDNAARFDELEQSIPDKITGANVMFGVAGAAAAAAVVLLFLEGRPTLEDYDRDSATSGLRLVPVVGRVSGVLLEARF